jgi:hypothetical protein
MIFHRSVTNVVNGSPQVGQRFAVEETPTKRPLAERFALAYGSVDTVTGADVAALQDLLREERPPRAVVGKAVEVMRDSAARSNGRVARLPWTCGRPALPKMRGAGRWPAPTLRTRGMVHRSARGPLSN